MSMLFLTLYWLAIGALAMYGLNCYVLSIQFVRHRSRHLARLEAVRTRWATTPSELPVVTVQLPIFNERLVVERLIDAVCINFTVFTSHYPGCQISCPDFSHYPVNLLKT